MSFYTEKAILSRSNGTFVIMHEGKPYHVAKKEDDPFGIYDLDEVRAFAEAHRELVRTDEPTPAEAYTANLARCEDSRRAAYQAESDPLMAQYLRDEIDKQVWLDKVAEIRARYPKPVVEPEPVAVDPVPFPDPVADPNPEPNPDPATEPAPQGDPAP